MEVSVSGNIAFIGGGTSTNYNSEGEAVLCAITFDDNMKILAHMDMDESSLVSRLCRINNSKTGIEILAVGFRKSIHIVDFRLDKFIIRKKVSG